MQLSLSLKKKEQVVFLPLNLILHVGSATEIMDTNQYQYQSATGKQIL